MLRTEFTPEEPSVKVALVTPTPEQIAGVRRIANDASGALRYVVPSRSTIGDAYVVTCPRGSVPVEYRCSCPWGASGRASCRHVGAVVAHLRLMFSKPQPDRAPMVRTAWTEEV